jgi:hypothetical protein
LWSATGESQTLEEFDVPVPRKTIDRLSARNRP